MSYYNDQGPQSVTVILYFIIFVLTGILIKLLIDLGGNQI